MKNCKSTKQVVEEALQSLSELDFVCKDDKSIEQQRVIVSNLYKGNFSYAQQIKLTVKTKKQLEQIKKVLKSHVKDLVEFLQPSALACIEELKKVDKK